MSISPQMGRRRPTDPMTRVVLRAMAQLNPAPADTEKTSRASQEIVAHMVMAVLDTDLAALPRLIDQLLAADVPASFIAERLVPQAARHLGDCWVCDELHFSAVTLGTNKLQSSLRHLESVWAGSVRPLHADTPRFLIAVPKGVQHTLGATVLAGQLRHRGYNVELDLELTPEALTDKMRTAPYSGLMLSASGLGHLENCRELVNCSKRASRNTPVIFGGTVLEQYQDLEFHTGADLVTLDVAEALDFCGLPDITMAHPANDHLPPSATTRSSQAGTPE